MSRALRARFARGGGEADAGFSVEKTRLPRPAYLPHAGDFSSETNLLGKGTREVRPIYTLLLVTLLMAHLGAAQSTPDQQAPAPEKQPSPTGPTAFAQFAVNSTPLGAVAAWDFNLGYNFTSHIGADAGLPIYTVRSPFSLVTNKDWRYTTIIGTPYLDVRYTTTRYGLNVTSILTGAFGLNSTRTFSTGRTVADWYNHVDHQFKVTGSSLTFTPFLNFGGGNGSFDRVVMARPYNIARLYESLGFIGNGEVGGTIKLRRNYGIGGSAYAFQPVGPQKVFSRLVSPDSLLASNGSHGRYFDAAFETIGPSKIARDNGYSAWLEVTRFRNLSIEVSYTRSVHYAYDSAFIMLKYDLTSLLRNLTIGE
ncbi:MAG: hypothetical protein LAO04_16200 [Acidobacteriia bacterium]|nr:hypothetical protein [Terriglobia bacterium]